MQITEFVVDGLMEIVKVLSNLVFGQEWALKLHLGQLVNNIGSQGLFDVTHRDLTISFGAFSDNTDAVFMELNDCFHHAHGLVHWTVKVVL